MRNVHFKLTLPPCVLWLFFCDDMWGRLLFCDDFDMEGRRVGGTELQQNIVWWLFGNVEIEIEQWKNSSVVEKGLEILSPCIDWARGICQDVATQHDKCRLRHDKKMTVKITYRDIRGHFLNEVGFLWDEDLCHVWELASLLDYLQNMPGEIVDTLQIKLSFWKDQNWI